MRLNLTIPGRSNLGRLAGACAGTVLLGLLAAGPARAGIEAGALRCEIAPGSGMLVGSQKAVSCTFRPSVAAPIERYTGTLTRIGLDLSQTQGGQLYYDVVEASSSLTRFSLAGTYTGAGAGLTIGLGVGVDALIGGNNNQVALQPVALSTTTGLGINAGIGSLTLVPAGVDPMRMHRHHRRHHHA